MNKLAHEKISSADVDIDIVQDLVTFLNLLKEDEGYNVIFGVDERMIPRLRRAYPNRASNIVIAVAPQVVLQSGMKPTRVREEQILETLLNLKMAFPKRKPKLIIPSFDLRAFTFIDVIGEN